MKFNYRIFNHRPLQVLTICSDDTNPNNQAIGSDHFFHCQVDPDFTIVAVVDFARKSAESNHSLKVCLQRNEAPFDKVHEILCDDTGLNKSSKVSLDLVFCDSSTGDVYCAVREAEKTMQKCTVVCFKIIAKDSKLVVAASCSYVIDGIAINVTKIFGSMTKRHFYFHFFTSTS